MPQSAIVASLKLHEHGRNKYCAAIYRPPIFAVFAAIYCFKISRDKMMIGTMMRAVYFHYRFITRHTRTHLFIRLFHYVISAVAAARVYFITPPPISISAAGRARRIVSFYHAGFCHY